MVIDQFIGSNVVGVKGVWKGETEETIIVNVYSPYTVQGKRIIWNELVNLRNSWGDEVSVVVGDFNAVKRKEERKGKNNINSIEIQEFKNFIDNMILQDIPLTGPTCTWYKVGMVTKVTDVGTVYLQQEDI